MMVVYVAGPYTAESTWEIEQNIRRAEYVALSVWRLGMAAICPHTMARFYGGTLPEAAWLAGDLELLGRCDAVLLVSGWERSKGTLAEIERAEVLGIPIFYQLSELESSALGGTLGMAPERRGGSDLGRPEPPLRGVG